MENEEEISPRPEEEVNEEIQEEQTKLEEVTSPEPVPEPAPEPKKSTKNSGPTDKKFEQWWKDHGEKLVQDGFSKRSIIVRAAKEFSENDTVLYTDVAQTVGSDVIQNPSIKEACREISKKIK